MNREDFEATVKNWRDLGLGHVHVDPFHNETSGSYMLATLRRSCRPDEAVHMARWMEVQALLSDGCHYSRAAYSGTVYFSMHVSRPLDEQDAIPEEVAHG